MKSKGIRTAAIITAIALILTGCKPIVNEIPKTTSIYATFYPIYAIAEMICSGTDGVELHCLVQPQDDCLRSYDLSDWDLYMLAYSADAVIAAGGGLEGFSDKLEEIGETSVPVAEVMHGLELYQPAGIADEDSHFTGKNPHLYMSIEGAEAIATNIFGMMSVLDENGVENYEQNMVCFIKKISALNETLEEQTKVCSGIPAAVLHEALFYPALDCGLDVHTWYVREGGEMLYGTALDEYMNALEEAGVQIVLLENYAPDELVSAIESAGFAVAELETMSTLSEQDGPQAYLDALKNNVLAIVDACRDLQDEFGGKAVEAGNNLY